jgi:CHRD domain
MSMRKFAGNGLRYGLGALALAAVLATVPAAFAETINYNVALKAGNEVPPNASTATGTLTATYDTATKKLDYTANYTGLTGPATMAHFHGPAEPGKNAPVVVPVVGSVASPIKGSATLTDAQAADLMAGKWYFNVHTAANKGGEIRGQVTK